MRRPRKTNNSNSNPIAEKTAEKQLEKLSLEIEQMKNRSKWHDRITPYISLLSVIITVGGFVFGIVQFQNQQDKTRLELEKQRNDEIQKRYENSVEKLLQFTKDEKNSIAVVGNLLVNLKSQIREKAAIRQNGIEPTPEQIAEEERRITRDVSYMLMESIKFDSNLDNFRDINFIASVVYNWDDIKSLLDEYPESIYVILDEHEKAILKIYRMDPSTIEEITFNADENTYLHSRNYGKIDPTKFGSFISLVDNYKFFYKLLKDEKRRETAVMEFQGVTCNRNLTQQTLGKSFEMENNPEFKDCAKK